MVETALAQDSKMRPLIIAAVGFLLLFETGVLLAGFPRSLAGNGDFSAFYRTAVMARSGELHSLYDVTKQDLFDRQVFPSLDRYPPYYFYHPPYEVLWLLPFGFMSYETAFLLWTGLSFLLLLLSARILEVQFPELRRVTGIPFALPLLAFFPVTMILLQGQDSPILLLLLALAFRRFDRKQDTACGVLLGLGLFKFQFIIPLVAILALRRRAKLISAFLLTSAALLAVSWVLVGTFGLRLYWNLLSHHTPEMVWRMPNLRGLVESLGGSPTLTICLSVCLVAWCAQRVARMEAGAFASAIVCAELVSYHGHIYDAVLFLIPVQWAINRAVIERKRIWTFWPALFFLMMPAYVLLTLYKTTWILALPFFLLAFMVGGAAEIAPSRYLKPWGEALP